MSIMGNEDHKQRVNLSALAQSVMELDRSVFSENQSLSGFLNRIITCFAPTAEASIDLAVAERKLQLLDSFPEPVAQSIADHYRTQLLRKKEAYPQGDSVTFRLNNYNFDYLYTQRAEGRSYSAPSKYLKALLEEYARLAPSEREQVFFRDLIEDTLQPAMDAGYLLNLRVGSTRFWVRPYSVEADPFSSHLYLIGLSRPESDPQAADTIASFRVTRLQDVKVRKRHSFGKITADDRRDIEQKVRQVGVQYLVGQREEIVVKLTEAGRREFLQRSYMRPYPDSIRGDEYRFTCTGRQVRNYFLPFGKEAQVLSPESLRQEMENTYRQALEAYLGNNVK